MSSEIKRMNPPTLFDASKNGHAQISIVEPGRIAFLSGQVAWTPDGAAVPSDIAEQMKLVSANAKAALAAIGARAKDVIMARLYMVDVTSERTDAIMGDFMATFEGELPSVTFIGVAALYSPDLQLELELVVRVPA